MVISAWISDCYSSNTARWVYWVCWVCYTCSISSLRCSCNQVCKILICLWSYCMSSQDRIINNIHIPTIGNITLNSDCITHCKVILTNIVQCIWSSDSKCNRNATTCSCIKITIIVCPCNYVTINSVYNSSLISKCATICILTCREVNCMGAIWCSILVKCICQSTRHW